MRLLEEILGVIKPTPQEMAAEQRFASMLLDHIRTNLPKGCDAVLTGSVAKKTFLRDKLDVDRSIIFRCFKSRQLLLGR